jgi:hypothetical protein
MQTTLKAQTLQGEQITSINAKQKIKKRIVLFFSPIGDISTEESWVEVMFHICNLEVSVLVAILTKALHKFPHVIRLIVDIISSNGPQ